MGNMSLEHIIGDYKEYVLQHFNSEPRTIYVSEIETPFPAGKLIVSRTDLAGNITHMNQAFIDMSGYSEAELIGQPHSILRHPDMPKAVFKEIWDTASEGKKWHGYVKNLRKDGGFYWVHATVIANIRDGEVMGLSSVRRQASMSKIAESEALYRQMLEQEKS